MQVHVCAGSCVCRYMYVKEHVCTYACRCRCVQVHVHVHAGACVCRSMCACTHIEVGRYPWELFLKCHLLFLLRQGLSLELDK